MLIEVFLKVLPLFLGILAGYVASYWRRFSEEAEPPISAFVFYIALPALLFVLTSGADLEDGIPTAFPLLILGVTVAFSAVAFIALLILSRGDQSGSFAAMMAGNYGNVAYLGIPVVLGLLGPAGGLPAVVGQLVHNLIFVLGYPVAHELLFGTHATGPKRWRSLAATIWKSLVGSPLIWAVALGFVVSVTKVHIFGPIMDFANMLAGAAAPAALFAIGLTLRGAARMLRGGHVRLAPVFSAAIGKLILLPAVTAAGVWLIAPDMARPWLVVLVVVAGMPTSATAFVLAQNNGGNGRTVAAIILVTNFLGILTLPVVAELFT